MTHEPSFILNTVKEMITQKFKPSKQTLRHRRSWQGWGHVQLRSRTLTWHAQKHWVQSPAPKGHNNNKGHEAAHSEVAQVARDGDFGAREATAR